jgi:hypothetical protein
LGFGRLVRDQRDAAVLPRQRIRFRHHLDLARELPLHLHRRLIAIYHFAKTAAHEDQLALTQVLHPSLKQQQPLDY